MEDVYLNKYEGVDFQKGFRYAIENAENHLKVAEKIKDISFGIAFSHLILSSEEAIKGMLLFQVHLDSDFLEEIGDFKNYFSNHKYKHEKIKNLQITLEVIEKVRQLFASGLIQKLQENSLTKNSQNKERQVQKDNQSNILHTYEMWWKQADANKQDGFYVDLLEKRKQWKGPHNFKLSRYNTGFKVVSDFLALVMKTVEIIERDSTRKIND